MWFCRSGVNVKRVLSAGLWYCGRINASGHPHHRVLPGLHLKHRILPPTLGSKSGARTWVEHTAHCHTLMIHSFRTKIKQFFIQPVTHSHTHTHTILVCSVYWCLSADKLFVSLQSCQRCCGVWWCVLRWNGMAMWEQWCSLWFLPSLLYWPSPFCWSWRDSQLSYMHFVYTGKKMWL